MPTTPTLISVAVFSLLAAHAAHADFSVQTPVFTQVTLPRPPSPVPRSDLSLLTLLFSHR